MLGKSFGSRYLITIHVFMLRLLSCTVFPSSTSQAAASLALQQEFSLFFGTMGTEQRRRGWLGPIGAQEWICKHYVVPDDHPSCFQSLHSCSSPACNLSRGEGHVNGIPSTKILPMVLFWILRAHTHRSCILQDYNEKMFKGALHYSLSCSFFFYSMSCL